MKAEKTFEARAFLEEACHSEWILRIYRLTLLPVISSSCTWIEMLFRNFRLWWPAAICSYHDSLFLWNCKSNYTLPSVSCLHGDFLFITAIHVTNKLRGLHTRRIGKCIVNFDTVKSKWTRMMFKIILKKRTWKFIAFWAMTQE